MTDLVERVARAIRCGQRFTTKAAARAAIAVVLEEAARKFEDVGRKFLDEANRTLSSSQETRAMLLEKVDQHFAVAAAIRALNPKERP